MQAVFRLIEDDRLRPVDHAISHFLATMCRQAMHEQRVFISLRHQGFIDLIGLENIVAARLVLLVH